MSKQQNSVRLVGKISRIGVLKYTPSGVAIREGLLAVNQNALGKESVGYYDLLFFGDIAERDAEKIRIGTSLVVQGSLWNRAYRNRKGAKVSETKVVVDEIRHREEKEPGVEHNQ